MQYYFLVNFILVQFLVQIAQNIQIVIVISISIIQYCQHLIQDDKNRDLKFPFEFQLAENFNGSRRLRKQCIKELKARF